MLGRGVPGRDPRRGYPNPHPPCKSSRPFPSAPSPATITNMAVNVREMSCSPESVFRVIADGWLFTAWVVGASRMRGVDDTWPAVGARLHHSFGSWPALIDDETTLLEWDPPHRVAMRPKGWPIGEAKVTIEVKRRGDGCVVRMEEHAARGPGAFVPAALLDLGLHPRNAEALQRLAFLAEGGAR